MSPFAEILAGPWQPLLGVLIFFVHGWVLWFVLGRNFTRTVLMTACARAAIGSGALALVASGALGRTDPGWEPDALAWAVAGLAAWLLCWAIEIAVLGILMRYLQPGWRWKAYDLVVLGVVQAVYLAGGQIRLG
jgi:hypothetical protein